MDDELQQIYSARFDEKAEDRVLLWKTLTASYFQQFVQAQDTVLDLAAGYCEFINSIACGEKIAVDLNPSVKVMAASGVRVIHCRCTELPSDLDGTVDVVWVSNFFEHLRDKDEFLETLAGIARVLRDGGTLLVLQPNIRLTKEAYWDFVDHSLPITEKSLAEALALTGFTIEAMKVRFLPYTTESRLPISPGSSPSPT